VSLNHHCEIFVTSGFLAPIAIFNVLCTNKRLRFKITYYKEKWLNIQQHEVYHLVSLLKVLVYFHSLVFKTLMLHGCIILVHSVYTLNGRQMSYVVASACSFKGSKKKGGHRKQPSLGGQAQLDR